ncbi:MAG: porin [Mariprofundaceae bacterium]|nr:porin [Mariprofundaceae bacterium]
MKIKSLYLWRVILLVTALLSSNFATAKETSLVDILTAKGVLTADEAIEIKKETKKKNKKLKLGGRIQVDFAVYKDPQGVDLANGAEVRRARLFAKGVFGDFYYKAQYDFSGNSVTIKDMYLEYRGLPVAIRLGNSTEPFSMEDNTSSKYVTFMERAMNNVFAPGRNMGLAVLSHGDSWGAIAGLYTNGAAGAVKNIDSKFDASARLSVAPFHTSSRIMHLGTSVNYRLPNSNRKVRFRARPESHVTGMRFVDTGNLTNVKNIFQYGLELAGVMDSLSLQGEYIHSSVKYQNALTPTSTFSGYYISASWFITGESRSYAVDEGTFGRTHPLKNFNAKGEGWGAWELATRFSQLNLEDTGVAGGKAQNITVALNWYPLSHVRWMFNWIHTSVDRSPLATAQTGFGPDVFQMRAQVDF